MLEGASPREAQLHDVAELNIEPFLTSMDKATERAGDDDEALLILNLDRILTQLEAETADSLVVVH